MNKIIRLNNPETYLKEDLQALLEAINSVSSDFPLHPTQYLLKQRLGFFGATEWSEWWKATYPVEALEPENLAVISSESEKQVTVKLDYSSQLYGSKQSHEITLQLYFNAARATAYERWQVEVVEPENDGFLTKNPVGWAIYMLSQPEGFVTKFRAERSMHQLKHLGLGMMMMIHDYENQYALAPQYWREAVSGYIVQLSNQPSDAVFTIPGTTELYCFNSNLSGKPQINIEAARNTVLLYEGKEQQLYFRDDGKSVVCFADGHVEIINTERAKTLIWNPWRTNSSNST
ncbi:MAG: hypothetical protein EOP04_28890 [Proteobacteria bacterium]|nr:MAG: hypothetical protein EOP04_28890 [Pseudomonadota bacterium]